MRQAGRYLADYRALRAQHSFMELMKSPALAAEVTLMPLEAIGTDALILFNDILTPLEAMGAELEFGDGGPKFRHPIANADDVARLVTPDPSIASPDIAETMRLVRASAGDDIPLLGFAGAPFTMASYLIEGGTSRTFHKTKLMMFQEPALFDRLLSMLAETIASYLRYEIANGADVVQLFDTWVGCLSPDDYRARILPVTRRCVELVRAGCDVPILLYGRYTSPLLEMMVETGVDGLGIDWTVDPADARRRVGQSVALQGNLDPDVLYAPRDEVVSRTLATLERFGSEPGHVFNLGHGILPDTPVDHARAVIETVKSYRREEARG